MDAKKLAVNGFYWSMRDKKARVLIVRDAGFWTILDLLKSNFGGEGDSYLASKAAWILVFFQFAVRACPQTCPQKPDKIATLQ